MYFTKICTFIIHWQLDLHMMGESVNTKEIFAKTNNTITTACRLHSLNSYFDVNKNFKGCKIIRPNACFISCLNPAMPTTNVTLLAGLRQLKHSHCSTKYSHR